MRPKSGTPAYNMIQKAAAAVANARGMRRGVPAITNILDLLPEKLRGEVIEDATEALDQAGAFELLEACKLAQAVLYLEGDYINKAEFEEVVNIRERIKVAIAKAEGRS